MISRLQGTLIEKQAPNVVIDIQGLGYEVSLPMSCFYQLPEVGEITTLFTHFVVREDAQLLYGFTTAQTRALFREVIKANGIGPKLALAILSAMTAEQFVESIHREEVSILIKIPGVGKKTAERLVIEMRDRLKDWSGFDLLNPQDPIVHSTQTKDSASSEAIDALISLGYKQTQAEKAIRQIAQVGMGSEDLIRHALKSML